MTFKTVPRGVLVALLTMPLLAACGKGKDAGMSAPPPQTSTPPATSSPATPPPSTMPPSSSTTPSTSSPSTTNDQGTTTSR